MDEVIGVLGILFLVIVVPLALILHYTTKWKEAKGLTSEEQQMLEDLWEGSERMLSRLDALETILDKRSGEWRDEAR
jgi:phage shock protein B